MSRARLHAVVVAVALAILVPSAGCPAPAAPRTAPHDAGAPVEAPRDDAGAGAAAPWTRAKLLPITKDGVGPLRAGAVTRRVVASVFLDHLNGSIEERTETTEGEVVGRAYSVKRGEGVDTVVEAIVHVDTHGTIYSVEVLAPIAEAHGVKVGDPLGKALGDEPVKCARGAEERQDAVFCARKSEPTILYMTRPEKPDGPVAQETLRALPVAGIVWNPHAT